MARPFHLTLLLVPLVTACGETWGRQSAVEIPLHRDLLGLNPKAPDCTLEKSEWEKRCNPENYGDDNVCPKECRPSEPGKGSRHK